MIIEAVKIVMSVFPFIKEAFLWREGPQAFTPPTPAQLLRRKIAVFVLIGSFFVNYLALTRLFEMHGSEDKLQVALKETKDTLKDTQAKLDQAHAVQSTLVSPSNCVAPTQMFDLVEIQVQKEIEQQIKLGILQRVAPKSTSRGKR